MLLQQDLIEHTVTSWDPNDIRNKALYFSSIIAQYAGSLSSIVWNLLSGVYLISESCIDNLNQKIYNE